VGNPWGATPEAPSVPARAGINRSKTMKSVTSTSTAVAALHKTRCVAMILCTALSSVTAFGQSESGDKTQLTVAELKTIYLDCDRDAMRGLLGGAEAKACSIAYEELKKRAFDGDFDKFLVWSRAQNSANIAAR
jgi:phosphoribosyl-AMP cyclohydrolase